MTPHRLRLAAGLTVLALAAAACGGTSTSTTTTSSGSASAGALAGAGTSTTVATTPAVRGPVTVDQCTGEKRDRTVTYTTVPQRIFTLDPQSAEFLIALGLGDRIVASWGMYPADVMKNVPEYADQLKKIKVVGDDKTWPPPVEQIAATHPDIVVTTYRLNIPGYLDATKLDTDLGIKAYTFLAGCTGAVTHTLDPEFEDIKNLGAIFDVKPAADALVTRLQGQLADAAKLNDGMARPSVWQYAGETPPYPVGGTGIPNAIIWLAGAKNVFEDVHAVYGEVSWEQVAKRNPQVVWMQTDAGPGFVQAEDGIKKATEKNPGLAQVDAVAHKRYVVIPYTTAGTLSIHNAEAVLEFAKLLHKAMGM
jgi:iron complex transport system substrate-binding protein